MPPQSQFYNQIEVSRLKHIASADPNLMQGMNGDNQQPNEQMMEQLINMENQIQQN